jgi:murein L,D-transpeptidase YafK
MINNKKRIIKIVLFIVVILTFVLYYFWPEGKLTKDQKFNKIIVYKSRREMMLYYNDALIASYNISLGGKKWPHPKFGPIFTHQLGKKTQLGDCKTPEGLYEVKKYGLGKYNPSLYIHYPNQQDKKNHFTGNSILIHGLNPSFGWLGKFHRWVDWTDGCIAVTDIEMEEINRSIVSPCTILINP